VARHLTIGRKTERRRSNTFRWAALFLIVVALGAVATTVLVVVITSTSKGIHASPESLARAVLVAMQNRSIDALVECLPAPQRDEFRQTFKSMPMPNSGITDFFIDSTKFEGSRAGWTNSKSRCCEGNLV
jgi:hypothetical protein